jgi:hypothetical protein
VLILPRCVSSLCNFLRIFLEISILIFSSFFSNRRKISTDSSKPKRKSVETRHAKRLPDTPVSEPPSPSPSTPTRNQQPPSPTLLNHPNFPTPTRPPLIPLNRNPNHSSSTANQPSHHPRAPSSTFARNPNPDPHTRASMTSARVREKRTIWGWMLGLC